MAASVLGVAGVVGLVLVLAGVLNPILIVPIIVFASLPLALGVLGKLFAHAQPMQDARPTAPVPTTKQASYDPVADPGDRS